MKNALCLTLSFGLAALGHAGLVFEAETVQETAAPTQDVHKSTFHFKVEGTTPITISEVQTTCGCLSAGADKKTYAPGESGTVTAFIKLGSFEGEISKSIFVYSDDPTARKRPLQMKITIPKLLEITPEVTTWQVGDEPVAKTVSIKVLYDKPIEITEAISTREKFTASVKEITKGREYQITITPETTAEPALGALKITTTCDVPRYKNRLAFFNVVRRSGAPRPLPVPAVPTAPTPSAPAAAPSSSTPPAEAK